MNYTWDPGIVFREPYLGWLLSGAEWSLALTAVSWTIALLIGVPVGAARGSAAPVLRLLASSYIELFRNVPPIVQLFMWFFVFPEIVPNGFGLWIKRDMPLPEFSVAALAIGLFAAARVAEQVRAGVETVRRRLLPAALATGLRPIQAYRLILLPVALRTIVGPLTSELLITFKMSSVSLTIGVMEMTAESQRLANETFHGFEAFAAATVFYLVVGWSISGAVRWFDRPRATRPSLP